MFVDELTMKDIYLLSGLGADKRVFDFIDFSGFKVNHIDWVSPLENESIGNYARRLSERITTAKPILIGVSFGGMMAVEIAKLIETERIILISSAQTRFDIPPYFRIIGRLRLNKLIPPTFLKKVNWLTYWFFGTTTEKEKELLRAIINDTDKAFSIWAIDKIVTWRNTRRLNNLTHIHGTRDRILPSKTADLIVNDGGHLMIMNRGSELSALIKEVLK